MEHTRVDAILERLRSDGGRVTAARRHVVEVLVALEGHHVTAPELVAAVRAADPDAQESTVYRTVDRLVDLEILTPIETTGGATTFHFSTAAHHHLVCERCGRVQGAAPDLLAEVADRLRRDHGFELRADAVTLPGRCLDCEQPSPPAGAGQPHGQAHTH